MGAGEENLPFSFVCLSSGLDRAGDKLVGPFGARTWGGRSDVANASLDRGDGSVALE